MKISNCVVGGALILSGLCPTRAVWAQGDEPEIVAQAPVAQAPMAQAPAAQAGATEQKMYQLRLRNVRPSLMAFWLDPRNHEIPSDLGPATAFGDKAPAPALKKGVLVLPEGVDRIIAVDPQNVLLVFGTPEGVAKLQETVAFLDRPLRQVEIETQFVSVKAENLAAFGIDFTTARGNNTNTAGMPPKVGSPGGVQVGFVRGNFQAALSQLQADNKIRVISAPRVTAINSFPASIESAISSPVVIGTQDEQGHFQPFYGQTEEGQVTPPLMARTSLHLEVTPTINNDDTVTVALCIDRRLQLSSGGPTREPTTLQTLNGLVTIANIRDGETIALAGFGPDFLMAFSPQAGPKMLISGKRVPTLGDIPLISQLFRSKTAAPDQLIVFITARIVRPIGEQATTR